MKKVSYTVRKDTAEKRLRIKGRFIKKEDQKDILERIFVDEDQISQSNVQRLNQNLHELVNSPRAKEKLLMPSQSACKDTQKRNMLESGQKKKQISKPLSASKRAISSASKTKKPEEKKENPEEEVNIKTKKDKSLKTSR